MPLREADTELNFSDMLHLSHAVREDEIRKTQHDRAHALIMSVPLRMLSGRLRVKWN